MYLTAEGLDQPEWREIRLLAKAALDAFGQLAICSAIFFIAPSNSSVEQPVSTEAPLSVVSDLKSNRLEVTAHLLPTRIKVVDKVFWAATARLTLLPALICATLA